jgi:hypothetical protein
MTIHLPKDVESERPAAEMMNNRIMGRGGVEPGAAPPRGQVFIVEEANRARTAR